MLCGTSETKTEKQNERKAVRKIKMKDIRVTVKVKDNRINMKISK